ncbi:chromosomal replication initiation protein, partial [Rubrivivax benzoatilyticus JA2 = ATCC BAA-35]
MTVDLWQRGCERLATELPEHQFNTWIRPLPPAQLSRDEADAAIVSVRVPNRFKLDWIRAQYAGRIESVLSDLAGKPVRLELTLAPRAETPTPAPLRASNGYAHATVPAPMAAPAAAAAAAAIAS